MTTNPVSAPQRKRLSDQLVEALIEAIAAGDYQVGAALPSEAELADMAKVSRLTVREAVKSLQARGLVRVEQGRGTFVNPPASWSALDAIVIVARSSNQAERTAITKRLIEARRLVEVGVAELAASRREQAHLEAMAEAIARAEAAHAAGDIDLFVDADLNFHNEIMKAAGNPFVAALFEPIRHLVHESRRHTSSFDEARGHAVRAHKRILRAISSGTATAARNAMRQHLEETEADLEEYSE
jgi:GntR family transcriptional regulator, transcriptional repressor for pyruvate dehydrogenase complex